MIQRIDILSSQGGFLSLIPGSNSSGFEVLNVEGLDPVKATIVSSSFAAKDGEVFQASRRERRNIQIRLGLAPDWVTTTVADLRRKLYSTIMPKSKVILTFALSDGLEVSIEGEIEELSTPQFTRDPVVDISILALDPDFSELDTVLINGTTTSTSETVSVNYAGTVETGFVLRVLADRSMPGFTVYHLASNGLLRSLEFESSILADDVVEISTVSGSKYASRTRTGLTTSVLYGVSPQSQWSELTTGPNEIRVYDDGDPVPYTISYQNKYGAI